MGGSAAADTVKLDVSPNSGYSESEMKRRLKGFFKKIKCLAVEHWTPFETVQEFIFCSFRRGAKEVAPI